MLFQDQACPKREHSVEQFVNGTRPTCACQPVLMCEYCFGLLHWRVALIVLYIVMNRNPTQEQYLATELANKF